MSELWTTLNRIDYMSALFGLLVGAAVLYLFRLDRDRDPSNPFKLVQFIATADGKADKYSLAYMGAFLVSTWTLWYLVTHDRLTEWFFTGYIGGFVIGGVWKSQIASKERIAEMKVNDPTPSPSAETKTELKATTTTTSPRIEA